MMTVHKFGGKALYDAACFRKAADLSASGESSSFVIVSAICGVTDALENIASMARKGEDASSALSALKNDISKIADGIFDTEAAGNQAAGYLDEVFSFLLKLSRKDRSDEAAKVIIAQGELISSQLFRMLLDERGIGYQYLPALDFVKTDSKGVPDEERLQRRLRESMEGAEVTVFVMEGFICRNILNEIDTLGRGGSDWTACLVASALGAGDVVIWTDVCLPENLSHVSYDEAAELGYFGNNILHPASIVPARLAGVPVRIKNIDDPTKEGSLIDSIQDRARLKAIVSKDGISVVQIKSSKMLLAHGYLRKIFEIFEGYGTAIDVICTSEIGISMTVDDSTHLDRIASDLQRFGLVRVDRDMCLIGVVGDFNWGGSVVQSKVFDALQGIPVRMVSYGGSQFNISIILGQQYKASALSALNAKMKD